MSGKSRNVHTVPNGKGWINVVAGDRTPTNHRTQATAAEAGRKIAIQQQSEHLIHGRNGQIREKNSYGDDPRRTKG